MCSWRHHMRSCMISGTLPWTSPSTSTACRCPEMRTRRCSSTPGCQMPRRRSCRPRLNHPGVPLGRLDSGPPSSPSRGMIPNRRSYPPPLGGCIRPRGSHRKSPGRWCQSPTLPWTPQGWRGAELRHRCTEPARNRSLPWGSCPAQSMDRTSSQSDPKTGRTSSLMSGRPENHRAQARTQCYQEGWCRHWPGSRARQWTRTC